MGAIPKYRLHVINAGGEEQIFSGVNSFKHGYVLNNGSGAEITVPVNYKKLTPAYSSIRLTWLRIERKDSPSASFRTVWYGNLYDVDASGGVTGGEVTLKFESLLSMLMHRKIDSSYSVASSTDQSQILWDLIDYTQTKTGGNLGLTRGAYPASVSRIPRQELQRRDIKDVLESYTKIINGLDLEITPTPKNSSIGVFNTYYRGATESYHKGSEHPEKLIYWIDANNLTNKKNNINQWQVTEQGKGFANSITVYGQAEQDDQIESTASDAASITARNLFEDDLDASEISNQQTLNDRATEELNTRKDIPRSVQFSLKPHGQPRFGTFDVGDIFNVQFKAYQFREFTTKYRLYAFDVSVNKVGTETINFQLGLL